MHDTIKTSPQQPISFLGRIGADPSRLLTVHDWWHEMEEPVDLLLDLESTFREEEEAITRLCRDNGISYQAATSTHCASFPIWIFTKIYW